MYNENLENLTVVKRSGQRVEFNASKVALAIKKAFDSVDNPQDDGAFKTFEKVLNYINENYKDRKTINVEEVQDIIEQKLKELNYNEVYNSFKEYRSKRTISRKVFPEKQQHKFLKAIEKFEKNDFYSLNHNGPFELLKKFGKIIFNEYTKTYILDTKSVRAYEEGNIYIHNLDYFALGVLSNTHLNLNERLENTDYDLDSLLNELTSARKEINGEIGINNIDNIFKNIYLNKFKKTLKYQYKKYFELLGFYEFINGRKIEDLISKEKDISYDETKYEICFANNKIKNIFETAYQDSKELIIDMIAKDIHKFFDQLSKAIDKNNKYILSFGNDNSALGTIINDFIIKTIAENKYPNLNFTIKTKYFDENYNNTIDKVLKIQDELFINNSENNYLEYFSDGSKIFKNTNSNINLSEGRSIVANTSINFARLALKCKNKTRDEFFDELSNVSDLVKNELCLSFETIGDKTKENYQALFTGNIFDDEKLESGQKIRKVIKNGVLNVGLIGLKECAIILEKDQNSQIKFINQILDFMNEKCEAYSIDTKLNFGIHETTDEKARCHLLKIDKAIYGTVEKITDKEKYELLDEKFMDINELGKIQNKFSYGKLITIKTNSNCTEDIIKLIKNKELEFVKLEVKDD